VEATCVLVCLCTLFTLGQDTVDIVQIIIPVHARGGLMSEGGWWSRWGRMTSAVVGGTLAGALGGAAAGSAISFLGIVGGAIVGGIGGALTGAATVSNDDD
jgi:hypothetical protein